MAWYAQRGVSRDQIKPDLVYGDLARTFLPTIMPGLLGVFVAALLGGVMSACGSVMISSSGLFTENIYKPWRPGRSNAHYLFVARIMMVVVVACGLAVAYWLPDVVAGLKIWFKVAPILGVAFWLGLLWRRATVAGAWASAIVALAAWWLATRGFVVDAVQGWAIAEPLAVGLASLGRTARDLRALADRLLPGCRYAGGHRGEPADAAGDRASSSTGSTP